MKQHELLIQHHGECTVTANDLVFLCGVYIHVRLCGFSADNSNSSHNPMTVCWSCDVQWPVQGVFVKCQLGLAPSPTYRLHNFLSQYDNICQGFAIWLYMLAVNRKTTFPLLENHSLRQYFFIIRTMICVLLHSTCSGRRFAFRRELRCLNMTHNTQTQFVPTVDRNTQVASTKTWPQICSLLRN